MHKSRLAQIIIDCRTSQLEEAAGFWAAALGRRAEKFDDPEDVDYRNLTGPPEEVRVLVQRVTHESRVHLDIETDDIEAEVARLEALGATKVAHVRQWWIMEAPTGQRFCVLPPQRPDFESGATVWTSEEKDATPQE